MSLWQNSGGKILTNGEKVFECETCPCETTVGAWSCGDFLTANPSLTFLISGISGSTCVHYELYPSFDNEWIRAAAASALNGSYDMEANGSEWESDEYAAEVELEQGYADSEDPEWCPEEEGSDQVVGNRFYFRCIDTSDSDPDNWIFEFDLDFSYIGPDQHSSFPDGLIQKTLAEWLAGVSLGGSDSTSELLFGGTIQLTTSPVLP